MCQVTNIYLQALIQGTAPQWKPEIHVPDVAQYAGRLKVIITCSGTCETGCASRDPTNQPWPLVLVERNLVPALTQLMAPVWWPELLAVDCYAGKTTLVRTIAAKDEHGLPMAA